jgi:hypothetical protein
VSPTQPAGAGRPTIAQLAPAPGATSATWGGKRQAQVVSVVAFKGGVGKTTTSRLLAARAADLGVRTWLIDANGGQGGQQVALRLTEMELPTVLDVAAGAPPESAILPPERLNQLRKQVTGGAYLPDLGFHVTFAPPKEAFDPDTVPVAVYNAVLGAGRRLFDQRARRPAFDLIVIDTQTAELWHRDNPGTTLASLVLPEVAAGHGWVLGLADIGLEGLTNQIDGYKRLAEHHGFTQSRLMTAVTMVPPGGQVDSNVRDLFAASSVWVGAVTRDPEVASAVDTGQTPHSHPAVAPTLDAVIETVLGPGVAPAPADGPDLPKRRRGRFRR